MEKVQAATRKHYFWIAIGCCIVFGVLAVIGVFAWGWILLVQTMALGCLIFLVSAWFANQGWLLASRYGLLLGFLPGAFVFSVAHPHPSDATPFFYRLPLFFCLQAAWFLFDFRTEKFHFGFVTLFLLALQTVGFHYFNPLINVEGHNLLALLGPIGNDVFVIFGTCGLLFIYQLYTREAPLVETLEEEVKKQLVQQEELLGQKEELQQMVALLEEKERNLREQIEAYDRLLAEFNAREGELKRVNEELQKTNLYLQKMREEEMRIQELDATLRLHLNEPLKAIAHLFFQYLQKRYQLVVGSYYYWEEKSAQLCLAMVYGYSEEDVPSTLSEKNRNLLYEVFLLKEPMVVDSHLASRVDLGFAEIHPQCLLVCPIFYHDEVIGVMGLVFLNPLESEEVEQIRKLCNHFAAYSVMKVWK
jgi:hypothetical protein